MPSKNEEEFFAKKDAELLGRKRQSAQQEKNRAEREKHFMKCPKCGAGLDEVEYRGVVVDRCSECAGVWFEAGEVDKMRGSDEPGFASGVLNSIFSIGSSGKHAR